MVTSIWYIAIANVFTAHLPRSDKKISKITNSPLLSNRYLTRKGERFSFWWYNLAATLIGRGSIKAAPPGQYNNLK